MNILRFFALMGCVLICSLGFGEQASGVHESGVAAREPVNVANANQDSEATQRQLPRAALFVRNMAGAEMVDHLGRMEEMLLAEFAGKGFRVMSSSDATRMVSRMTSFREDEREPVDHVAQAINSNTNALRLAQNLDSDFLLVVSINSLSRETREINMHGVQREIENTRLRLSYRMAHSDWGDHVLGGNVESMVNRSKSESFSETGSGHIDRLLHHAVLKLAEEYDKKGKELIERSPEVLADAGREEVSFSVVCIVQDLSVPDIVLSPSGYYSISSTSVDVVALDVTVDLNGLTIGSAPGTFEARTGIHQLRLTRDGFRPWHRSVAIREGTDFRVALQLTDEELARWKDRTSFLQDLVKDRTSFLQDLVSENKLVDAQVELIEGLAEMFSNSGFRVDVQIEATELPSPVINMPGQSLWKSLSGTGGN